MYKCHFEGGVGTDKIPLGGHLSTVKALQCTFNDVCCAIDAEGFVNAAFDNSSITNIVEHPTDAVFGRPVVARNFSKVYIKNSPTFYGAGPLGKRNTATNQSEITGAPYSHAAEDGFAIYRGWDASQLLLSGGTGRDVNNVRGGGLALFGSAYTGSAALSGDAHLNCGPSNQASVSIGHVDGVGTRTKLLTAYRTGDVEVLRSVSFGVQGKILANTLPASTAAIYCETAGNVLLVAKNAEGVAKTVKILDYAGAETTGSNAKGNFTKFPDGTLITWGKQLVTAAVPAGQGVTWDPGTANQPSPFIGTPNAEVRFAMMSGTGGTGNALYTLHQYHYQAEDLATVGVNMGTQPSLSHPLMTYGTTAAASYFVFFKCTGRWK